MFRVQSKTKACVCLACTCALLLALYHSCADEASMVSGQPISVITMAQPPHLPDMPHTESDAQHLARSLAEVREKIVFQDFIATAEFSSSITTGA
jgi:hypothetical protein